MAQSQTQEIKQTCRRAVPLSDSMTAVIKQPGTQGGESVYQQKEQEGLDETGNGWQFSPVFPGEEPLVSPLETVKCSRG